jgi:hypothetical protein
VGRNDRILQQIATVARDIADTPASHLIQPTAPPVSFSPHCATASSGPGPPHYRGFTITLRHTTLDRTPLEEWSSRRREPYLTTQHAQQTYRRNWRDSNPQPRQDPCLRSRGHRFWHLCTLTFCDYKSFNTDLLPGSRVANWNEFLHADGGLFLLLQRKVGTLLSYGITQETSLWICWQEIR